MKKRLGVVMGSAIATLIALFAVQEALALRSAIINRPILGANTSEVDELRRVQSEKLSDIDRAIATLATSGDRRPDAIAPVTSSDPAPAAGWMHDPDYVAPPPPVPVEDIPILDEEVIPEEGGTAPAPAPTPAPAAPEAP